MASTSRAARTKAQQRAETTGALLAAARRSFAERGYAHTSLAEVVAAAGVTKGALYHHFGGKDDLFAAVLAEVHGEVADRVAAAAAGADPWTQLIAGCRTFLAASTEAHVGQIMLVDAPAVLGWDAWRELDAATSMQHLQDVLVDLMRAGVIADRPVLPLVHLLSGAMNEAALWLAGSTDRDRDLADVMAALTSFLESLRS